MPSSVDSIGIVLTIILPPLFFFRHSLHGFLKSQNSSSTKVSSSSTPAASDHDSRNFIHKMTETSKRCVVFYGSQTGTAEEYAVRLAKEAKARFGISSLVCDPEEYDMEFLDQIQNNSCVIFIMATYGEGEPTDNANAMMELLSEPSPEFSQGGSSLENLNYVIFGLGNKTYEYYNEVARKLDARLTALGANRIGERGEGDDDKNLEEDYLAWKDDMWAAFSERMGVEEGNAGDVADFVVQELNDYNSDKVYHGELSARALLASTGSDNMPFKVYGLKNPYPAPISSCKELFSVDSDRNCIHIEFDITNSGLTYQHGDHVGIWPSNPDIEIDRIMTTLGLAAPERRQAVVNIESLDPALAKVPFPTPTTYEAIFRHYLDISAVASRQAIASFARFAPSETAAQKLTRWGSNKDVYINEIYNPALKLAEVFQLATDDSRSPPFNSQTVWNIPFDRLVSTVPRLQPRYYSISSSPKLHPNTIHATAVVLKYQASNSLHHHEPRWVFGLSTNFILNVKMAHHHNERVLKGETKSTFVMQDIPSYNLSGPRGAYAAGNHYRIPIHVRRSTFRLPTSPKVPVIMVGPGTGVAPFRGFVQERVALGRKAIEKNGPNALKDWAPVYLFYGCRRSDEDFLYRDEWAQYTEELKAIFKLSVAFSREMKKPDGSKVYVQDLIHDLRSELAPLILNKRAYIYICGDAKNMCKAVEETLMDILGSEKGGSAEVEGARELKILKERNVCFIL
nr:NADPH-ferrihemoprotein reductase [Cryptococcus depauperatus CBS 7855]